MEQLARLKARLDSLHELRDLFRALRALAASHVQEAQGALAGMRSYAEILEDALAEGVALLPAADAGPATQAVGAGALIVITSEHGFVGALNEELLDRAAELASPGGRLLIAGRRGARLAAERGLAVEKSFAMATQVGGVLGMTRRIADQLKDAAAVEVLFAGYRRGGGYEVERRGILPLDPSVFGRSKFASPPLHHLPAADLMQRLAGEYLFAEITRAAVEALASENAARLRIMESADRSIDDKMRNLKRQENAMRQESITAELLDVVTGSEAILGGEAAEGAART
jgi:F-type H+-transporting ATPase subunit gamma